MTLPPFPFKPGMVLFGVAFIWPSKCFLSLYWSLSNYSNFICPFLVTSEELYFYIDFYEISTDLSSKLRAFLFKALWNQSFSYFFILFIFRASLLSRSCRYFGSFSSNDLRFTFGRAIIGLKLYFKSAIFGRYILSFSGFSII